MGDLKKRLRKLETTRIKELDQAVDEFVCMIINALRSMAPERRTWLIEEFKKMRGCCGNYQPRKPQGIKQYGTDAIAAMQGFLSVIGKIESEVKNMVIEGLNEKAGISDIYLEVLTPFCDGQA